jgi:hypothetical protein
MRFGRFTGNTDRSGELQAKGNDPTAVLARWWIDEFEEAEKEETYPEEPTPTIH